MCNKLNKDSINPSSPENLDDYPSLYPFKFFFFEKKNPNKVATNKFHSGSTSFLYGLNPYILFLERRNAISSRYFSNFAINQREELQRGEGTKWWGVVEGESQMPDGKLTRHAFDNDLSREVSRGNYMEHFLSFFFGLFRRFLTTF